MVAVEKSLVIAAHKGGCNKNSLDSCKALFGIKILPVTPRVGRLESSGNFHRSRDRKVHLLEDAREPPPVTVDDRENPWFLVVPIVWTFGALVGHQPLARDILEKLREVFPVGVEKKMPVHRRNRPSSRKTPDPKIRVIGEGQDTALVGFFTLVHQHFEDKIHQ